MTNEEVVLRHQRTIAGEYPLLNFPLDMKEDPAGDFALATYKGFNEKGEARLTFDTSPPPSISVVAHELFHGGHELAAGRVSRERLDGAAYVIREDDPVLVGFWEAMAYRTPLAHAIQISAERRYWTYYVGEQVAEAFAYVATGSQSGSQTWFHLYGGDIGGRLPQLKEFFKSLTSKVVLTKEEEMTPEEFEKRWMEMYRKVQVAETFDGMKKVDADLATDFRLHTHETSIAKIGG